MLHLGERHAILWALGSGQGRLDRPKIQLEDISENRVWRGIITKQALLTAIGIRKKGTGKIILSSSTKYAAPEQARAEMARAIRFGKLPSGFSRKMTSDGNHYFNVIDDTGEVIARRIEYFKTAEELNAAIDELMEYLRVQYSDEGMYLIE